MGDCCVGTVTESPYVSNPVSWPLVPTDELRLMTSRSTSFLSRTLQAGASSGMVLTPERNQSHIDAIRLKQASTEIPPHT